MRIAWVTPWDRVCGIADYARGLLPEIQALVAHGGGAAEVVSLDAHRSRRSVVAAVTAARPDVVHFQHEYGIYRSPWPPFHRFPGLVRDVGAALPSARRVATAHTVLPPLRSMPPPRRPVIGPLVRKARVAREESSNRRTWGPLDAVIVHSEIQVDLLLSAVAGARAAAIPHYLPRAEPLPLLQDAELRTLVVFGFLTPPKGQSLVIEALALLGPRYRLVLAGGPPPGEGGKYESACRALATDLGVAGRCRFTGYVPREAIGDVLAGAHLAVAPFLATTGSGSLTHSLARGLPAVASDHPINREIARRQPGALAFFRLGDAEDLARCVRAAFDDAGARPRLREAGLAYAAAHSVESVAALHADLYARLAR
jgi:glycosyltransferase involved in cell wall biosynthesis